jgi:DNA polymerase III alpha subunit
VLAHVISLCSTQAEIERVNKEYELFKERELDDVLRFFIYLVDYLRENSIVWGVGRGSSVASYILFLIGVHKIDSMRYSLDIKEFLK